MKKFLRSIENQMSSAYSESLNEKSIPFVVGLRPVKMKSYLVLKMHNGVSYIFLHVIVMAAMNVVKSIGPSMYPCFTPIMLQRM